MLQFPYIFTFYSFKGGVGRSLALLNTAYTMAGRGRHVLVVDMDLEAPGISSFLLRQEELAVPKAAHPLDVLALLSAAIDALKAGGAPKDVASNLPPISNYIRSVADDKLAPLRPKLGQLGRFDVVVADRDRDYWRRWAEVGIQRLPQDQLIALSSVLHHYFKAQRFAHRPLGLETFESALPTPYDYVLVDSRTGITELGGLCVGPLADRLIVLTSLNEQNVDGTLSFMEEAGITPKPRAKEERPWDEADARTNDESEALSLGPKPTLVVASPVPSGEIAFKRARLDEIAKRLGIRPIPLSYHPQMALLESVFVRDYPEEYLASEYRTLADRIMARVSDHPAQLAQRSATLWNEKGAKADAIACVLRLAPHQPELGIPLLRRLSYGLESSSQEEFWAERQLHALLSQDPEGRPSALDNWGNALGNQAKTKQGEAADRLFGAAYEKYAEALRLKPDKHYALNNWGITLGDQAKTKQGEAADQLFEAACQKYAEALSLKPDLHEALKNWGNALLAQAKTKQGEAADRLFEAAYEKYAEAIKLKPDKHETLSNWGSALTDQATTKQGEATDRLFEAAYEKYAEAIKLKPDKHETLSNWGDALVAQAKTKQGEATDRLFEAAYEKYAEALKIKPDKHEALNKWGNALLAQAKTKQGEAADRLFEAAYEKYAEAIKLKPDKHNTLSNWGSALTDQAKTKQGEAADRLFEAAYEKYAGALRLKPDKHDALNNWGAALAEQAKTKQGEAADRLFEAAYEKYAEAIKLKPDKHNTLSNWGSALTDQAKTKQGEAADRLFEAAYEKYAGALRLKPDKHDALNNWGATLAEQAKTKQGEAADRLFEAAYEKYAGALRLKPDKHEALNNWGAALTLQAKTKQGEAADRLLEGAYEKYAEALRLKPDIHDALSNWGAALMYQSRSKPSGALQQLRRAAREKLLAAEHIQRGSAAYNLACVEAGDGNVGEAIQWLRRYASAGAQLSRKELVEDADLDPIRDAPAFSEFLQSLPEV